MYNVRVIKYAHSGYQIRLYDNLIGGDFFDNVSEGQSIFKDIEDDYKKRGYVYMENPFTEEMEWVYDMTDKPTQEVLERNAERSAYVSMARSKQNVFYIARSNSWDWFFTLTFNPEKVDSFNYDVVTKKLSQWLNNMKKKCPDLKYLLVPEQHDSGRWHFHGVFANCDNLGFTDSGKKTKKNEPIYNVDCYRLGFSTATKVTSTEKVSKYISKYITKEVCLSTKGKRRYWCSKNVERAEFCDSVFTFEEKEQFIAFLAEHITRIKKVGSHEFNNGITYIELEKGVEFDI